LSLCNKPSLTTAVPPPARADLGSASKQRDAVTRFAAAEEFEILAEFVEIKTGKGANALDRLPQLTAALATGRAKRCPVIGQLT
jgi:hypothetical protein